MNKQEFINRYHIDILTYTANELRQIVRTINEKNKWSFEKFIAFKEFSDGEKVIHFWEHGESIRLRKVDDVNFKMV